MISCGMQGNFLGFFGGHMCEYYTVKVVVIDN